MKKSTKKTYSVVRHTNGDALKALVGDIVHRFNELEELFDEYVDIFRELVTQAIGAKNIVEVRRDGFAVVAHVVDLCTPAQWDKPPRGWTSLMAIIAEELDNLGLGQRYRPIVLGFDLLPPKKAKAVRQKIRNWARKRVQSVDTMI